MDKYYSVTVRYSKENRENLIKLGIINSNSLVTGLISVHIIKASSLKKALEIANKHEIGNPFHSKFVNTRHVKKIDMQYIFHNKELIERRLQGKGGSIWYEDEKGNLQKETI